MWPIAKEDPLGIVQEVQPEGSYFGDGPQMTPYHKKLVEGVGRYKTILHASLLLICLEICNGHITYNIVVVLRRVLLAYLGEV